MERIIAMLEIVYLLIKQFEATMKAETFSQLFTLNRLFNSRFYY